MVSKAREFALQIPRVTSGNSDSFDKIKDHGLLRELDDLLLMCVSSLYHCATTKASLARPNVNLDYLGRSALRHPCQLLPFSSQVVMQVKG